MRFDWSWLPFISSTASEGEKEERFIQHFSHPHPLTLIIPDDDGVICAVCQSSCSGGDHTYGCQQCSPGFYMHKSCMADLPQEVQHFSHPCPLILSVRCPDLECDGCSRSCASGFNFHCDNCQFDLCVDCFFQYPDRREDLHLFFHPCPLIFQIRPRFCCDACGEWNSGFSYYCDQCNFTLHIECASSLTEKRSVGNGEEEIQHYIHWHRLMLVSEETKKFELLICGLCGNHCSSHPTYGCKKCYFNVQKSCIDLPRRIQHPIHACPLVLITRHTYYCRACENPRSGLTFCCGMCSFHLCPCCFLITNQENYKGPSNQLPVEIGHILHPCLLTLKISSDLTICDACHKGHSGFTYKCGNCLFNMDVECALLPSTASEVEGDNQIQHFSHQHPLTLFEKVEDINNEAAPCAACKEPCSNISSGCHQCKFYLHQSCMNSLQLKIENPFHSCPIILLTRETYYCRGCDQIYSEALAFSCRRCGFHLCISCSMPNKVNHFLHIDYLLVYSDKGLTDHAQCSICSELCSDSTYSCDRCQFFLHKSCAELPKEIQSPFYVFNPLFLSSVATVFAMKWQCRLCVKNCKSFGYQDRHHDFQLCLECSFLWPNIQIEDEDRLFTLVHGTYDGQITCKKCARSLSGDSYWLISENLKEGYHILCGPLPCTIKHQCHVHPLTLKDYHLGGDDDDGDTEDLCCHVCEEKRDPGLCAYYCAQGCPMTCHGKCVISEVIASLAGEYGAINLRVVGTGQRGTIIRCKESVYEEKEQNINIWNPRIQEAALLELSKAEELEIMDVAASFSRKEGREDEVAFDYSMEGFIQLKNRLDSLPFLFNELDIDSVMKKDDKVIPLGGYYVCVPFAQMVEELFARSGDIGAESTLCPKSKSFFLNLLCHTIHSMRMKKVRNVSQNDLVQWMKNLRFVEGAGFKIQFILDRIDYVTCAHFGLEARKFIDDTTNECKHAFNQLMEENKELEGKIELNRQEMQEIKIYEQEHRAFVAAATSSFMKERLKDGSDMKWKAVMHGLL